MRQFYEFDADPSTSECFCCRTQGQAEHVKALACFSWFMKESRSSAQLELVEQWFRVVLQWGANPELQLYR